MPSWDVRNVVRSVADNTWLLCFGRHICSFQESSLVNKPVVQECVSCLVRGLLPSGIHTISFPGSEERHSQAQIRTALHFQPGEERWTEVTNGLPQTGHVLVLNYHDVADNDHRPVYTLHFNYSSMCVYRHSECS